jgi:methionyl-tRNA formyltransferase
MLAFAVRSALSATRYGAYHQISERGKLKKYRTVFIGNRPLILSGLAKHPQVDLVHAFIIQDSLINESHCPGVNVTICEPKAADVVLEFLRSDGYEICVSAGCPYILPISSLPTDKVFINSHPSALPLGRGIHPINESIFSSHKKAGASLHYLVDELDAGDIIHQVVFDLSDDIDLDFLYAFIFELECEVFFDGFEMILAADLRYKGTPQQGHTTYYSREPKDLFANVHTIGKQEFLEKVRAFSSDSLGIRIKCDGQDIIVFKAMLIINKFINKRFEKTAPGSLIKSDKNFLLLRLNDGIVKIDKWFVPNHEVVSQ